MRGWTEGGIGRGRRRERHGVSHARPEITVRETSDMRLESEEATAEEKQPVPFLGADKDEGVVLFCPPASLLGAPAV